MKFTTTYGHDIDIRALAFDELETLLAGELDFDDRSLLEAERARRLVNDYRVRNLQRQEARRIREEPMVPIDGWARRR